MGDYDYLDFELYTIDELREEMQKDLEAADKTAKAAMQEVIDWVEQKAAKEESLTERTRQTTNRRKSRKR